MIAQSTVESRHRGYGLIGLLVTFAIIIVLFTISMTAMNKAVTGEGSTPPGTAYSMQDQMMLRNLYTAMYTYSNDNRGWFPVPSVHARQEDHGLDTTANLYSMLVMENYTTTDALVSANEHSGYVEVKQTYDYRSYDRTLNVQWDTSFRADLDSLSHTSFAHTPMHGERCEQQWGVTGDGLFPIIGTRGPKDGVHNPSSWTYSRTGKWGGHFVTAGGAIEFVDRFYAPNLTTIIDGLAKDDNIFKMEHGPDGDDAILAFTKTMLSSGPELQFD